MNEERRYDCWVHLQFATIADIYSRKDTTIADIQQIVAEAIDDISPDVPVTILLTSLKDRVDIYLYPGCYASGPSEVELN